jgi:hypothetical protein
MLGRTFGGATVAFLQGIFVLLISFLIINFRFNIFPFLSSFSPSVPFIRIV